MKKIITLSLIIAMLMLVAACSNNTASDTSIDEQLKSELTSLKEKVAEAGYDVADAYVDSTFKEVVYAFSVKVKFDANTIASIPIVITRTEEAAKTNCETIGENSIKQPIRNGNIFSYPGKDYPEHIISLISAIVNGEDIPENIQ